MLYEEVLVAQWIERLVAVQKVAGSIPAKDTLKNVDFGRNRTRKGVGKTWVFPGRKF